MCFSATASVLAGTALSGVGIAAMRRTTRRSGVPMAMIPLLFGVQQFTEGLVWLSVREGGESWNAAATWMYALFAFTVWPIFIPLAMWVMEPRGSRKRLLFALQFLGFLVGAFLLLEHSRDPVVSEVVGRSIAYNNSHFHGTLVLVVYFAATLGALLVSSNRTANQFGILTAIAALVSYLVWSISFFSVWCFGAAILSVIIVRSGPEGRTTETPFTRTSFLLPPREGSRGCN